MHARLRESCAIASGGISAPDVFRRPIRPVDDPLSTVRNDHSRALNKFHARSSQRREMTESGVGPPWTWTHPTSVTCRSRSRSRSCAGVAPQPRERCTARRSHSDDECRFQDCRRSLRQTCAGVAQRRRWRCSDPRLHCDLPCCFPSVVHAFWCSA